MRETKNGNDLIAFIEKMMRWLNMNDKHDDRHAETTQYMLSRSHSIEATLTLVRILWWHRRRRRREFEFNGSFDCNRFCSRGRQFKVNKNVQRLCRDIFRLKFKWSDRKINQLVTSASPYKCCDRKLIHSRERERDHFDKLPCRNYWNKYTFWCTKVNEKRRKIELERRKEQIYESTWKRNEKKEPKVSWNWEKTLTVK